LAPQVLLFFMMKMMLVSAALGFAVGLAVAVPPAMAANECADCTPADTAPNASALSSRDAIRAARSQDAKRIADEPATRPWDGMKWTAPPPKPPVVK
jgi:hypothetical protein